MLAAAKEMSMTDFILQLLEEKYGWCPLGLNHSPNAEIIAAIESNEKGKEIKSFDSMNALFEDLGDLDSVVTKINRPYSRLFSL